jgi:ABC-type lipoprotein export system ATPase subunit
VVNLIRHEMNSRGTAAIIVTHDDLITHSADRAARIVDRRVTDPGARDTHYGPWPCDLLTGSWRR